LWFNGGDVVSIHTLACAAYEIFHAVSKKRDPFRRDLLFDSDLVKDEYRREFINHIKKHANFFKHGDRDSEEIIDFNPLVSEGFMLFAILGRALCGESQSDEESAFLWWRIFNRPDTLTEKGIKLTEQISPESLNDVRSVPKNMFFEAFRIARRMPAPRRHYIPDSVFDTSES
jgi:hypothetical protein